jgi:hypothetical protein
MLTFENVLSQPLTENDAGVILTRNGGFKVFASGAAGLDLGNIPEDVLAQTRKLQILTLVLSNDELLEQLGNVVDNMNEAGVALISLGRPT